MALSASKGSIFLSLKRTIGNASESLFGSTSNSSSSTRTAASGITSVMSAREPGFTPTSSNAFRMAAITATRSTILPGLRLGATAPAASVTRATAESGDAAVSARAATTP